MESFKDEILYRVHYFYADGHEDTSSILSDLAKLQRFFKTDLSQFEGNAWTPVKVTVESHVVHYFEWEEYNG